ncbi:YbdD/YjiX family protein [Marisediminicola senii]|uniref:YbdD/YjiX family protein n=1 Tax=Marisediminicola senii TaxID=2711233 RepID=UPI001F3B50A0|nr:YbdD/YjiX family protein [Marisediminicola senii]
MSGATAAHGGTRASAAIGAIARAARGLRWYVRELMGDSRYERYVAHLAATHPGAPVPTERQFWRDRHAEEDANPSSRCC